MQPTYKQQTDEEGVCS